MEQAVYQYLTNSLSSDGETRQQSEKGLFELEATNLEYPAVLAKILSSEQCEFTQRQAAGILLKNYINKHWSPSSEKFVEPCPIPEIKALVRELSFNTLSCGVTKIRFAAARVVSRLAHFDWPEEWPTFVEMLIKLIQNGDRAGAHGSLMAFSEFASKDLSDQQMSQIGPVLFPELFKAFSHQTKVYALEVFHNLIEMINMIRDVNPALEHHLLAPVVGSWLSYAKATLQPAKLDPLHLSLLIQVIKMLYKLSSLFPSYLAGHESELLSLVINNLESVSKLYIDQQVYENDTPSDFDLTGQDELENVPQLEHFLYPCFEFMGSVAMKKNRSAMMGEGGERLGHVMWLTVALHQVAGEQVEQWNDDPNRFVSDDDEETFNYTVRVAAQDFLVVLMSKYGKDAIRALNKACEMHIQNANQMHKENNQNWWLLTESCLSAVGHASLELIEQYQYELDNKIAIKLFDLESLFSTLVVPLMSNSAFPLAQGRAFIFTSQFCTILPADLGLQCLGSAITMMKSSPSILVNISGLKAVSNFCRHLPTSSLIQCTPSMFEATISIADQVNDDILVLLLETWASMIAISDEVTSRYADQLIPKVMDTWARNAVDHIVTELIRELIEELASNAAVYERLVSLVAPGLVKMISNPNTDGIVLSSSVDLLTSLVEGGPSPLPPNFIATTFPPILSTASRDETELHVSISEFIKHCAFKDLNQIIHYQPNQSGLDLVVQFVIGMLSRSDGSCFSIGPLVLTLLLKNTEVMIPHLSHLLVPLTQRLLSTESITLRQQLVIVLAQLTRTHLDTVIQFLSQPMDNIENPLAHVIGLWLEGHDSFSGYFQIKLSAFALALIFAKDDARLHQIQVKGKLIDINPGRIVTRSQTRKAGEHYTMVPAPAKILENLISDYRSDAYATELSALEELIDDDGWADLDEDDESGGQGFINNGLDKDKYFLLEDELYKQDPLYDYDLMGHLNQLFQQGKLTNLGQFNHYAPILELQDQEFLAKL